MVMVVDHVVTVTIHRCIDHHNRSDTERLLIPASAGTARIAEVMDTVTGVEAVSASASDAERCGS